MKAIVIFDTLYGNTQKIAEALANGLKETGTEADLVNIHQVRTEELSKYNLFVIGAPTQYLTASKPMKELLERLEGLDFAGKYGFAFDTKLGSPLSGSAAKYIEKKLAKVGLQIIRPRVSAIVIGKKKSSDQVGDSVLKEGMEDNFFVIGKELGTVLQKAAKVGEVQ